MNIIAVEGKVPCFCRLGQWIGEQMPSAQTAVFSDAESALAFVAERGAAVVFIGAPVVGHSPIALARRVREICPLCDIVFCAADASRTLDAFSVGASDYLIQPLTAKKLSHALGQLRHPLPVQIPKGRLFVRCCGEFEVFYNGRPLLSLTRRAKELFAFLVDRRGAECDAKEVCDVLFRNMSDVNFRIACKNLRQALDEIGQGDVLIRTWGKVAVNMDALVCDCAEYANGNLLAPRQDRGEYMRQYEWAARRTSGGICR